MISKAVKSMLKEVDYNGSLIPVSSLNDSSGTESPLTHCEDQAQIGMLLAGTEIPVQRLYPELLDMSHCLIQQTREKAREVFAVVKNRIVTTQPFSVIEVQRGGGGGTDELLWAQEHPSSSLLL
ncbi:unnamed protein product [Coregonus sp. 'balchen']|nr:unnamed protein product [Coregonus sp. 'balchen']